MKLVKKYIKLTKRKRVVMFFVIFLILFQTLTHIYDFNFKYKEKDTVKEVMVLSLKKVEDKKVSYLVRYNKNNFILTIYSRNEEKDIDKKYLNFKYADKLKIMGEISIPKKLGNPNEFDYKRYLNSKAIVGNISTYSASKIGEKQGIILFKMVYELKEKVSEKIKNNFNQKEAGLLSSMLYGDSLDMDEEIKNDLASNGLSHIVSVSGINISYLLMIISYFFETKEGKKEHPYITIIIVVLFVIFSGMQISVLRAGIMNVAGSIAKIQKKKLKKYTLCIISLICIVIYNPYSIFNVSTIFSYLAVFSIITYNKIIESFFDIKLKKLLKFKYVEKNKLKRGIYNIFKYIIKILSLYISVQIFTLPVQLYYYGYFSLTQVFSNILLSPLISAIFLIGFLTIIFMFVPFISNILFLAESFLLILFIYFSSILANFEVKLTLPKPNFFLLLLYYVFMVIILNRKKVILIVKRKYVKKVKNIISVILVIYIAINVVVNVYILYFENYVYFFNVEQGNMAFIRYNRKNILVDYGSTRKGLASNTLANFLKLKGITKIDLVIISHMHDDHMNGLLDEKNSVTTQKIIYALPKEENENFIKVEEIARNKNIAFIEADMYETYEYDGIEIFVLSPRKDKEIVAEDIQNANSLVTAILVNNKRILFMGDATKETEKEMLSNIQNIQDINLKNKIEKHLKNIDILQVAHHGSKTSTTEKFISYVLPKEAVISSKKEKFGHPSKETVDTLKKYSVKIHITEKEGSIKFKLY